MCMMCDGADLDEALFRLDWLVQRNGFALVSVDGRNGRVWTYTVGLTGRGHPELVVAEVVHDHASEVLAGLAERVRAGERLDVVDRVAYADGLEAELVDVHELHVRRGLVEAGRVYYESLASPSSPAPPVAVRQVVLPDAEFCSGHAGSQPRLDRPINVLGLVLPNRAERRARRRRSRGHRR